MTHKCLVLFLGLIMAASLARSEERGRLSPKAPPRALATLVRQHITDLGSHDYETRERAMRALEALGQVATPALQEALLTTDPEVHRRVQSLAARLARHQEQQDLLQPTRIRLVFRETPLNVAVQEFARVSGCPVTLDPEAADTLEDRTVTLDTGFTTFWDALARFCHAAGLKELGEDTTEVVAESASPRQNLIKAQIAWMVDSYRGGIVPALSGGAIQLTPGTALKLPTFHAGSLRFRALPLESCRALWSSPRVEGEALIGLEILPESRFGWHEVQSVRIDRAIDEQGQHLEQPSLYMDRPPAGLNPYDEVVMWSVYREPQYAQQGGQKVPLTLRRARKPSTRLKELSGVAVVRLQTPPLPIATIDRVMTSVDRPVKGEDGSVVKVLEAERNDKGLLLLRVQVHRPQPEGWDGANIWGGRFRTRLDGLMEADTLGAESLTLFDTRGHLVRLVRCENVDDGTGGPGEFRLTYQLAEGQPDPSRLVLQGRRSAVLEVPFTLRDVPLP